MRYANLGAEVGQVMRNTPADAVEERAVPQVMTEIACALGDLETAVRALGGRISPLLPAGDPFGHPNKETASTPKPVRSHFCDELHNRLYVIQGITERVNEMVRSLEM